MQPLFCCLWLAFSVPQSASTAVDSMSQSVLENYFQALGGREQLQAIRDITYNSTIFDGFTLLESTRRIKSPNASVMEVSADKKVVIKTIFNGTQGITFQLGQRVPMSQEAALAAALESRIIPELWFASQGVRVTYAGLALFEGKQAHRLVCVPADGKSFELFFDPDSHLKLGYRAKTVDNQGAAFWQTTLYSDYKLVDGIRLAHQITQKSQRQQLEIFHLSIILNSGLEDSLFVIPD